MPRGAGLAANSLDAMREAGAEFVAPAPDCVISDDYTVLEQQLFNVAQAQLTTPGMLCSLPESNDRLQRAEPPSGRPSDGMGQ